MSGLTERLVTAAEQGDLGGVKAALAAGADVNASGPNANALHCAVFGGFGPIVKLLLDSGADAEVVSAQGFPPIHLAASKDHAKLVKLLGEKAAVDQRGKKDGTALHVAAASGCLKSVRALVELGADLEAKDDDQRTPLLLAAIHARLKVVKELIKLGADLEGRDAAGYTAAHASAIVTREKKNQLHGWSSRGQDGGVPCSYVARHGQLVYTRGSSPERVLPLTELRKIAKLSWAPPALSELLDNADCFAKLAAAGANLQNRDEAGFSVVHTLAELGEPRLMKLLKDDEPWSLAAKSGATPLHFAAKSKRPDGLEFALERAPETINVADGNGYTPLHYLCDVGGPEKMFDVLLAAGADKSMETTKSLGPLKAGSTPADIARHWNDLEAAKRVS